MPKLRRARPVFAVIATVLSVAALAPRETAAASCAGQSHELLLSDGGVSPGSGTTNTQFDFTVTYTDNGSCAPDRIVVVIGGVGTYPLSPGSGTLQAGRAFGRSLKLPAGSWHYRFEALSGSGVGQRDVKLTKVDPPVVVVTAPTPKPTPRPLPRPTADPTPSPTATPGTTASPAPTHPPGASQGPSPAAASPDTGVPRATATPLPGAVTPGTVATGGGMSPLMLAVIASTVGTIGGLGLFGVLGAWLLAPRRSRAGSYRRPGGARDPALLERRP